MNLQGDIVGIVDSAGALVVEYKYDAWGKPIARSSLTTAYEALGRLNPFRYRGYVWDEETELYYLRSRYYRPEWGWFVNADVCLGWSSTSIYECSECDGCPLKEKSIRACGCKKPLAKQHKVIYVSKRFARQREAMEAKSFSPKGCLLQVNRSIQAEGNFAYVKHDLDFRRFLLRGNTKVAAEWLLFSLAFNILRLHQKIQNGRLGSKLIVPSSFPAGL